MYPLMENQPYAADMQRRLIDEIEAARPRFVVLVNVAVSWNVGQMSDRTLFRWWDRYQKGFARVGVTDIMDRGTPLGPTVGDENFWASTLSGTTSGTLCRRSPRGYTEILSAPSGRRGTPRANIVALIQVWEKAPPL